MMNVVSNSIPSQRGVWGTDWDVAFGAVMIPMKRGSRPMGADDVPVSIRVLAIAGEFPNPGRTRPAGTLDCNAPFIRRDALQGSENERRNINEVCSLGSGAGTVSGLVWY